VVVWQKKIDGSHYEVRTAGHSIRLYRNSVFHSQYNSQRMLNGGVWDMLWIPLCFLPPQRIRRVLMLGVGAGAALKKISDFFPDAEITGVELDRNHLRIARRFVGLRGPSIELVEADALAWVQASEAPRYDVIIDDLFNEVDGEPYRVINFSNRWLRLLRQRLSANGLLIANCVKMVEAKCLTQRYRSDPSLAVSGSGKHGFNHGYVLQQQGFDNVVVAACQQPLSTRELKKRFGLLQLSPTVKSPVKFPALLKLRKIA
jgi:spermidine synthase